MGAGMDDAGDGVYDGGAHEGALELQKLRFIGRLDRLLGVDKFWSEKWLLLLVFAQDLSLFWKYPVVWPWTFWRDVAWLNAFSLDTVSTRAYSLPDCFDCLPNNTATCELREAGCFPTLTIPSRTGSIAVLLVGTAAFAAWLLLARAPQRGLLDPSVAVNLERVAYPFLFCFHLPAATRLVFTLCNYRTAVVEQWECSPDVAGVVWAAVGAVFVLGFPVMVGRRIALQSFYSSAAKHSVYVRSRELEYMLAIGTAYRDRRLWLQSSYVRAGRYCPVLYMCQKLLLLLVILLHGAVSERAGHVLMVMGLATYFVPAVLISTGLWRLYRLGSSQCVQLLFLWGAVAMSGLGCLNALGGRVLDDSTLALILGRLAYGAVAAFALGLLVLFYLTHDFPTLADLRSGRLVHEGRADAVAAKKADAAAASATSARKLHRRHARHRHLGESLRSLVLEACRAKFERRERPRGQDNSNSGGFDRATNCAEVTLAVAAAGFAEEDVVRDLALFLRVPCEREDFAVVAADAADAVFLDPRGTVSRAVRVAVSSETVAVSAVVKEICGRCCAGGDLLREALGAQTVLDAAVAEAAAAVPADALCLCAAEAGEAGEADAFFRLFRAAAAAADDDDDEAGEAQDGSSHGEEGWEARASWVVAEQDGDAASDDAAAAAAALAPYVGRRVVSVAGVPMPRCDGTQGAGATAAAVAKFVESLRWLERAELPVAVAGQEAAYEWATVYSQEDGASAASGDAGCGRRQGEDHEVALMASLMQRRAGADGAVFTAVGRGPAGEVSYWVLPPTSNISFSWPVSKALVEQIEKENATNRFVDVLLDTHALLAEVSFMHRTPELVRVPALVFHARRVARCLQACRNLRVTHHLNAVHPLAPTFEEALELLVHEVRVHQKASLAVGRRADRLPIVSAFLHHRMNERKRFFALASPRAQRVFMKLLVLRMFVQLLDRKPELYPCARRARAGSNRVSVFGAGGGGEGASTPRAADSRTTALRKTSSAPPLPSVRARLSRTSSDPGVAVAAAAAAEAEALGRRVACVEEEEEPAAREGVEAAWWAEAVEHVSWARAAGGRLVLEGEEVGARREVVEERWGEWERVVWQGLEADETLRRRATAHEAEKVAPALYETFRETRQLLQMRAGREQRAEAKRARDATDALARWRDAFAAANRRPPTLHDVLADAAAAALHAGYAATLKEGEEPELVFPDALPSPPPPPLPPPPEAAVVEEASVSSPPPQPLPQPSQAVEVAPVGGEAPSPPPPPVAEKKPAKEKKKKGRKAELAAQLNAWKTAYKEEHGKDPTKRVLKSDPGVADVYAEYLQLVGEKQQAQTPPQPPVETAPPPPPTASSSSEQAKGDDEAPASFEDMPLAELKAFVKGRVATLNAWKAAYKEERGKEPTKQVLLRSDGIKDVYTSYVQANEVLKARKSKRAEQGGASSPAPPE